MLFETRRHAMDVAIDWLMFEGFTQRGLYISPILFEQSWFAAQFKGAAK